MPAAYQDENGKWFKQCSKTGMLFGPVENKEELSEWFYKKKKIDGYDTACKSVRVDENKQYYQYNKQKTCEYNRKRRINKREEIKLYRKSSKGLYKDYKSRAKKKRN